MTLHPPLWTQSPVPEEPKFPAVADRALITASLNAGVLDTEDLKVSATSRPMSVDVSPGICIVNGTHATRQGRYLCLSDDVVQVNLDAAPGAGQSRRDIVVAQVRDPELAGGTVADWVIGSVAGAPSTGSPAAPAIPPSSLVLAAFTIPPNAVTINSSSIDDRRALCRPVAVQSALPYFAEPGQIITRTGDDITFVRSDDGSWIELSRRGALQKEMITTAAGPVGAPTATEGTTWLALDIGTPRTGRITVRADFTCYGRSASSASACPQVRVGIGFDDITAAGASWSQWVATDVTGNGRRAAFNVAHTRTGNVGGAVRITGQIRSGTPAAGGTALTEFLNGTLIGRVTAS